MKHVSVLFTPEVTKTFVLHFKVTDDFENTECFSLHLIHRSFGSAKSDPLWSLLKLLTNRVVVSDVSTLVQSLQIALELKFDCILKIFSLNY